MFKYLNLLGTTFKCKARVIYIIKLFVEKIFNKKRFFTKPKPYKIEI